MLAIKNNLMAQSAARHLGRSYEHLSTSVERLSSGLRINSAKDDAAGLAVRELIRADVAALQQGSRNAADGVSMLQAAEGALGEIDSILVRMRELAEQASTGTYSSTQKSIMQNEYDELAKEITRIATTTDFNDINLLQGTGSVSITLGAGVQANQTIDVTRQAMDASALSLSVQTTTTASSAGSAEAVLLDAGDWITAAGAAGSSNAAFSFSDGGGGGSATVSITFEGVTSTVQFAQGNLTLDALAAGHSRLTWDTTAGALRFDGAAVGDVTDLAITIDAGAGGTVAYGSTGGTVIGAGAQTYSLVETGFTTTDGVASAASGSVTTAVSLTNGTIAQGVIDSAIESKDSYRAKLGYWMNRLEYAGSVLDVQAENLSAAESRISDVDVASEMSMMTRNQVLAQAGISMLAQANSMPQMALSLLQ